MYRIWNRWDLLKMMMIMCVAWDVKHNSVPLAWKLPKQRWVWHATCFAVVGSWLSAVMENTSSTRQWRCVTRASARHRSSSGHTTRPSMPSARAPVPFRSSRISRSRSRSNRILVPKVSAGVCCVKTGLFRQTLFSPPTTWVSVGARRFKPFSILMRQMIIAVAIVLAGPYANHLQLYSRQKYARSLSLSFWQAKYSYWCRSRAAFTLEINFEILFQNKNFKNYFSKVSTFTLK